MKLAGIFFLISSFCCALEPIVINHDQLRDFSLNDNHLKGIATASLGSKEFEVWRSSWAVGGCTPPHTHDTEEIFVFIRGQGKVIIDEKETHFKAPCTIICPANVQHQFFNTGKEPTDSIVIMGLHSEITNNDGKAMELPWRD